MVAVEADTMCCQNIDENAMIDETNMSKSATCETGREGKGLTSLSLPVSSISSCQPGKVASKRNVTAAQGSAM